MDTNYVYISNIPKNSKPVLFLHAFQNKRARMLYLENTFSGSRDALVYNPVRKYSDTIKGVESLRSQKTGDTDNLLVQYIFIPPDGVFLTTMIPDGASMLPYILLEQLPKEVKPTEVIADLPLELMDVKQWDIVERQDKCLLIKIPANFTFPMRSFILGTLRSRSINNCYPKVSELIISPEPILGNVMVPRTLLGNQTIKSRQSNLFYLHGIPPKITVKMLIESIKTENIKGCQVFFLQMQNRHKYGFIYIPKSLPSKRFIMLFEKLRDKNVWIVPTKPLNANPQISDTSNSNSDQVQSKLYTSNRGEPKDLSIDEQEDWGEDIVADCDVNIPNIQNINNDIDSEEQLQDKTMLKPINTAPRSIQNSINISQVWFRGEGCDPPNIEEIDGDSTSDDVMVLSHFLYIAGVPPLISSQQLLYGCPSNLRLSLFNVNTMTTQLGFLTFPQGMDPNSCNLTVKHLRGLNFTGCNLEVNEIYIRCSDLTKAPPTRWCDESISRPAIIANNMNTAHGQTNKAILNRLTHMNGASVGMQDSVNIPVSSFHNTTNFAMASHQNINNNNNNNSNNNNDMARLFATLLTSIAQNSIAVQPQQQEIPINNIANQMLAAMNGQQMGTNSNINYDNRRKRTVENAFETDWKPENIVLAQVPDDELNIVKSDFVCVDNLPTNVDSATLVVSAGRTASGCVILPSSDGYNKAFMYFPGCSSEDWLHVLCNLSKKNFNGKKAIIREVYLQTGNLINPATSQILLDTDVIFIYNIDQSTHVNEIYKLDPGMIHHAEIMETYGDNKTAFVVVKYGASEYGMMHCLNIIRHKFIGHNNCYADYVKLSPVSLVLGKRRRI